MQAPAFGIQVWELLPWEYSTGYNVMCGVVEVNQEGEAYQEPLGVDEIKTRALVMKSKEGMLRTK